MIYVIADDLTGASDTGAQMTKLGYNTKVFIFNNQERITVDHLHRTNVAVIDTETRDADPLTTKKKIRNVFEKITMNDSDIFYKKIDSTLRGNIGVEIEEIMAQLKKDICILTPSFSSTNRITIGGYLMVKNEPLGLSEYYQGDLEPGDASFIPSLLQEQTNLSIGSIDLKDVLKGHENIVKKIQELFSQGMRIIVVDAVNDNNLKEILKGGFFFKRSVLFCGSAGLASSISEIYSNKKFPKPDHIKNNDPLLIVGGTRNKSLLAQIENLKESCPVCDLKIRISNILQDREKALFECTERILDCCKQDDHLILRPHPYYNHKKIMEELLDDHSLTYRDLEMRIRDFLGEITAAILKKTSTRNLILSGGDTAIGVCRALNIQRLQIIEELLPGIPISKTYADEYGPLQIITKAGGFGDENTLVQLLKKIRED